MILNVDYPIGASCKVPTEDTICGNLIEENSIPEDYTLVNCNWTKCINGWGLQRTQQKLNDTKVQLVAAGRDVQKSIFICQHISADKLVWPSGLVFSPHATKGNHHIAIPHIACSYPTFRSERKLTASFMGSFETHWTRPLLENHKSSNVTIINSGVWYHYNPDEFRKSTYENLLAISKFTFCPRGTGPSTIRIWEALAAGSIPVIFSDSLALPNIDYDWNDVVIFIPEQNIMNAMNILSRYSDNDIVTMSNAGMKVFQEYCSQENIHKFIINEIQAC